MAYKQKLDELMDREMDRLEFLRFSAMVLVGMVGISRVLDSFRPTSSKTVDGGYGGGTYGGEGDIASANLQSSSSQSFSAK